MYCYCDCDCDYDYDYGYGYGYDYDNDNDYDYDYGCDCDYDCAYDCNYDCDCDCDCDCDFIIIYKQNKLNSVLFYFKMVKIFSSIKDYLTTYGYLVNNDVRTGDIRTDKELVDGIKLFQRYGGLKETGVVDADTLALMGTDRCGVADFSKSDRARRKRRYTITGVWKTNVSSFVCFQHYEVINAMEYFVRFLLFSTLCFAIYISQDRL